MQVMTKAEDKVQKVKLSFEYPVVFTRNVFSVENTALKDVLPMGNTPVKALAFVDSGLAESTPGLTQKISAYATHHGFPLAQDPIVVPGGEEAKNGWQHVLNAVDIIQRNRLCRHSYVLAAGGGAFLDAIGFAASLVHRGVRLVRLPSTTLSQDDSGVGVKNGINERGQKNLLGAFAPPFAVVNDFAFLETLPHEVMMDGIAEAFKVAIIKDAVGFRFLEESAERLGRGEARVVEEAVERSARLHLDHIQNNGDPFEMGQARPLDFGHWAAHRMETMSGYTLRHGQAVAINIALDSIYASRKGMITERERDRIIDAIRKTGLPVWHRLLEELDANEKLAVLEGIEQFREHLGGRLTVTFPKSIGQRIEVHEIDQDLMVEGIALLKKLQAE